MADLGTLTTTIVGKISFVQPLNHPAASGASAAPTKASEMSAVVRRLPLDFTSQDQGRTLDLDGTISGTVKNGGTAVSGAVVMLFHRRSGRLLDRAVTDSSGGFSFSGLFQANSAYFAVAFDTDSGDLLDALIHDYLTPV